MKKLTTQKKHKSKLRNLKSYAAYLVCVAFYFVSFRALALEQSSQKLLQENSQELQQIESYLNNINTLSANFVQKSVEVNSPKGNLVEGKFFLSRSTKYAGKMRIEYLAQPKIIIIVNGSVLSYLDVELDEVSHLSTNTTPASFLTRPNISFSAKDVELTNIEKFEDKIKVSVMKKNRKEAGEFSLIFKTNPLQFIKMEVKNDLGQVVNVTLSGVDFTTPIPDHLFVIKSKILP